MELSSTINLVLSYFLLIRFTSSLLVQRDVTIDDSCLRYIPHSGPRRLYYRRTIPAFVEAQSFAKLALDSNFPGSAAYLHYFNPEDSELVQRVFESIAKTIEPGFVDDQVVYKCGNDQTPFCGSYPFPLAGTDSTPGGSIFFCDSFFNTDIPLTRFDIFDKNMVAGPDGWCQTGQEYKFFELAAATVLHEMTHLGEWRRPHL